MPFRLELQREGKKINRNSDILVITGDGKGLLQDLDKFYNFCKDADFMSIGRSFNAVEEPPLHYVDVDADAGKWVAENLQLQYPGNYTPDLIRHTLGSKDDAAWFDNTWDLVGNPWPSEDVMWHGSTAFFGLLIGIEMGYRRIVLCGVPMDSKGHWYFKNEKEGPRWSGECYQVWFEFAAGARAFICRSFSGYTKQLLGEPNKEWLNGT